MVQSRPSENNLKLKPGELAFNLKYTNQAGRKVTLTFPEQSFPQCFPLLFFAAVAASVCPTAAGSGGGGKGPRESNRLKQLQFPSFSSHSWKENTRCPNGNLATHLLLVLHYYYYYY